jgi:steroid delta-isomerase-like uncharacterized protein
VSGQDAVENNKRVVERCFTDIWNDGNLDAVDELIHPNIVRHHERNQDEDLHGREEFRAWISQTRQAFPDLRLTIEQIFGEADRVMAHVRGRATHKGEFKGVPATGSGIEWTATALVRVADSKIVECWVIADTLGILQQLGVIQRTQ